MAIAAKSMRPMPGESTRNRIVHIAMNLASREGLESLSIGDLAKELGMSKSGLFAHFGSKEELQLATIEAAEKVFGHAVLESAFAAPEGLPRLRACLENYIRYLEDCIFPGGCFFSAVAAEYDDRPGRIRDRIAISMRKWSDVLLEQAKAARERDELKPDVDEEQLVFELKAYTHEANFSRRLLDDGLALGQALKAVGSRLDDVASRAGRAALRR